MGKGELIFSIAMLGVLGFFAMHMFEGQRRAALAANQDIEVVSIVQSMRQLLSDPLSCSRTFRGFDLTREGSGPAQLIKVYSQNSDRTKMLESTRFHASDLRLGSSDLILLPYRLITQSRFGGEAVEGRAFLHIRFDRGFMALKGQMIEREIPIYFKKSPEGIQCRTSPLSGVTEAFVQEGTVLRPDSGRLSIGGASSGAGLFVDGSLAIGNLGTNACIASQMGTIRFVPSVLTFEFCTGVSWQVLTQSPSVRLR
jgi:hypothetical protein